MKRPLTEVISVYNNHPTNKSDSVFFLSMWRNETFHPACSGDEIMSSDSSRTWANEVFILLVIWSLELRRWEEMVFFLCSCKQESRQDSYLLSLCSGSG